MKKIVESSHSSNLKSPKIEKEVGNRPSSVITKESYKSSSTEKSFVSFATIKSQKLKSLMLSEKELFDNELNWVKKIRMGKIKERKKIRVH